jgi:glutaredoxin 3
MPRIVLYTTPYCGYCRAAKRLLAAKNQDFVELDVSGDRDLREEMVARAFGGRTVPQIFIDGGHIGGYDELAQLDREAKLDPWLAAAPRLEEAEAAVRVEALAEVDATDEPGR